MTEKTKNFTLRVPIDAYRELLDQCHEEHRSLHNLVLHIVLTHVKSRLDARYREEDLS